MAIEARLIGRLGGGVEVTTTPIDAQQTGQTWATVWTVEVPAGETWLIALAATTRNSSGSFEPYLRWRDGAISIPNGTAQPLRIVEEIAGPETATLELRAPRTNDTATITGTVYTAPLP